MRIEDAVPGGIRPTDHLHVETNDGTCSRCRKPIGEDEVATRLFLRDRHDLYLYCVRCLSVGGIAIAADLSLGPNQ